MNNSRFVYVIYIRTTAQKLWEALMDTEMTKQYWVQTWQESDWKVGASWKIMLPDGRVGDSGEVVAFEPYKKMVLKWRNEFVPGMKEEGYSQCTYLLEPEGESIKLSVIHEMDKPESKLIEGVSQGWPHILSSLKSLLETGESLVETRKWPEGY